MGRVFVYSFEDCSLTIQHPQVGSFSAYGTGLGNFTISYANDTTAHQVSADLAVVISKHAIKNGTVTIDVLQSSEFNAWLTHWAAYIEQAPVQEFANTTMTIRNRSTGDVYFCSGCTHQKIADQSYQSEAQTRQWTIMCADIVSQ